MKKSAGLEKIDKFYLILTIVLVVMSALIIFSFRSVFSLFLTAYELDPNTLPQSVKVDKGKLNAANNMVFTENITRLENPESLQVNIRSENNP